MRVKYKSSIGTGSFFDVLPKKLTFRMNRPVWHYTQAATIFEELMPVLEVPKSDIRPFINDKQWPKIIFNKLVETIDRLWDDSMLQVISHSSGYDSRVLSMAIKELGKEPVFVEMYGEGEAFTKIMKYFGWKNYLIYNYNNLYKIRFSEAYKQFMAPVGYPFNIFYNSITDMQDEGLLPANIQVFTGLGQNESNRVLHKGSLQDYYNFLTRRATNNFKMLDDFIAPFIDPEFLETRAKYHTGINMTYDMISCPVLKALPNINMVARASRGDMRFKNLDQNISDFKRSAIGKKVKTMPVKNIEYNQWWGMYIAASFVEQIKDREITY